MPEKDKNCIFFDRFTSGRSFTQQNTKSRKMRLVLCLLFGFLFPFCLSASSCSVIVHLIALLFSALCGENKVLWSAFGKGSHGKPFTCPTSSLVTVFPFVLLFVRLVNDERWWSFLRRATGMLKCALGSFSHPKASARRVCWWFRRENEDAWERPSFQFLPS